MVKLLNAGVQRVHLWCLSSWLGKVTLWGGLNHVVDAVAGGKRMCLMESSSGPL